MVKSAINRRGIIMAFNRIAASVAAAALLAAGAGSGMAGASTIPAVRWRFSYVSRVPDSAFVSVAAISARDAWAVGDGPGRGDAPTALVERLNGRSWSAVRLPRPFRTANLFTVAATSPKDVWIFGQYRYSTGGNSYAFALRWNGSWSVRGQWKIGGYASVGPAVVAGADNEWLFFEDTVPPATNALHFNGQRWKPYRLPFTVIRASAAPGGDVWAVGFRTTSGRQVVERWHDGRWQQQLVVQSGYLADVSAVSARDVWVTGQAITTAAASDAMVLQFLHGSWTAHNPPASWFPNGLAPLGGDQDGSGGLWLRTGTWLGHYADDSWQQVKLPALPDALTWITDLADAPRSTVMFAVGHSIPDTTSPVGLVFKFSS